MSDHICPYMPPNAAVWSSAINKDGWVLAIGNKAECYSVVVPIYVCPWCGLRLKAKGEAE